MAAMVTSRQDSMSNFSSSLDMDDVHTPASDYSSYSQGNMIATASGPFLYSQTGHTDLDGSVWETSAEGPQNFQGDDDFHYTYGQVTPRGQGQDHTDAMDDIPSKWIATEQAEPLRRIGSRSSSGSRKNRTIKASGHKSRPKLHSAVSQSSHMSSLDMTGNSQMDAYLLPDSDAHSASSQMYFSTLPMSVGLSTDSLAYSSAVLAPGMTQQHIDPAQMQYDFGTSLAGNSPTASWNSLSPVGSRISSPGIPEDASSWSMPMETSPAHTNDSSPVMNGMSPSLDSQIGMMTTDDANGVVLSEDMFALPPSFTRRSSGDGESSARDHPLYKTAYPQADGLFHCPWEGQSGCNHKPEKLKCNYDKFVDSHLKPYRCKIESCENARFSSTACLLRHEREAHAMHGHGDKPYLCTYDGCDRALSGNGFPRQWNLKDHMRRVHNDNGSSLNMASGSPPSGHGSHSHSTKGRKRKNKDSVDSSSSNRKHSSKAAQAESATVISQAVEQPMFEEWSSHHQALSSYLQDYNTADAFDQLQQLSAARDHLDAMGKISQKLHYSRKGHSHDAYRRSYGRHSG